MEPVPLPSALASLPMCKNPLFFRMPLTRMWEYPPTKYLSLFPLGSYKRCLMQKQKKTKKKKKKQSDWWSLVLVRKVFEHSPDLSEANPGKRGLSFFGNNTNMNVILASREDRVWRVSQGKERPLRRLNGGVVDVS